MTQTGWTADVAQSIQCLSNSHKALGLIPTNGLVDQHCDTRIQDVEIGIAVVDGYPCLHSNSEINLGYKRQCPG